MVKPWFRFWLSRLFSEVGFFAGATIPGPSSRGPLMDLALRFGWPVFYDGAPPSGEPGVDAEFWQITFDARVFTYLLP